MSLASDHGIMPPPSTPSVDAGCRCHVRVTKLQAHGSPRAAGTSPYPRSPRLVRSQRFSLSQTAMRRGTHAHRTGRGCRVRLRVIPPSLSALMCVAVCPLHPRTQPSSVVCFTVAGATTPCTKHLARQNGERTIGVTDNGKKRCFT